MNHSLALHGIPGNITLTQQPRLTELRLQSTKITKTLVIH